MVFLFLVFVWMGLDWLVLFLVSCSSLGIGIFRVFFRVIVIRFCRWWLVVWLVEFVVIFDGR